MIKGLEHVGTDHQCSVCQCEFSDDEGGIQGYLGIIPVAFCPTCYAGIFDMVEQLDGREWEDLTDEEMLTLEETTACTKDESWLRNLTRAIEAKLKEKNYEGED